MPVYKPLAIEYPKVAATWHPTKNDGYTPETMPPTSGYKAYWRCAAGHEWIETVNARTHLPAWKRGDRAACRLCVGYHVITTFACGHTVQVETKHANPSKDCPACRKEARQERQERYQRELPVRRERARQAYKDCKEEAQELLNGIERPSELPNPMLFEWKRHGLNTVRRAIVDEREFNHPGATGTALKQLRCQIDTLVPAQDELKRAIDRREPVRILEKAHWPMGWLHFLGYSHPLRSSSSILLEELTTWLQNAHRADIAPHLANLGTSYGTAILTDAVCRWADQQERKWKHRRWLSYRELSIPLAPTGAARYGRLDVVVMSPGNPDIAVEIDSDTKPTSAEKLMFARDAGAVPIWVRWGKGTVNVPEDVYLIDLRTP